MNEPEFIFVLPGNKWNNVYLNACNELRSVHNVKFINLYNKNGLIYSFLRRVIYSKKLNQYKLISFYSKYTRNKWKFVLESYIFNRWKTYYVIFFNLSLPPIGAEKRLEAIRKSNVKYILYCTDSWESPSLDIAKEYERTFRFDYFVTFDYADAHRYGIYYMPFPYSIFDDSKTKYNTIIDLIYVGLAKERLQELTNIYLVAKDKIGTIYYSITGVANNEIKVNGIKYNHWIQYENIVKIVKKSNCILEYLFQSQSASTLRYYEAVCYNKKLLTNNKNVVNLPFYNPDYIHVFEKPEDIDWDWVKERIPVDYHYDGRFSPTHLIDRIIELEEEKESRQNVEKEIS